MPQAAAIDEAHAYPHALFGQLAGLGLFGMRYPEDVGGSGARADRVLRSRWTRSRAARCRSPAAAAMQSLMGTKFLHMLGNADIVERLFKPALRGEKHRRASA